MSEREDNLGARRAGAEESWTRGRVLRLAHGLATRLFGDGDLGLDVACAAQEQLGQTIDSQKQNRKKREDSKAHTKMLPSSAHALQKLVLKTSRVVGWAQEEIQLGSTGEGYRQAEERGLLDLVEQAASLPITHEAMELRYLEVMESEGFSLNSQVLAVANCCLLRPFNVPSCGDIYALLNGDASLGNFAYKQEGKVRKSQGERFGHFVKARALRLDGVAEAARERADAFMAALGGVKLTRNNPFQALLDENHIDLEGMPLRVEKRLIEEVVRVRGLLSVFTPWGVGCPAETESRRGDKFSEHFSSLIEDIEETTVQLLTAPTPQDRREMFRVHALICTRCFCSFVKELFTSKKDVKWLASAHAFAVPAFDLGATRAR